MKKYVNVNIVDSEDNEKLANFIIVIPSDEHIFYKEKLKELQDMIHNEFDNFEEIYTFIEDNFEVLSISDNVEIEW